VSQDAPLLERLAGLPPVPVATLLSLLARPETARDPLLGGLVGTTEEGEPGLHPLAAGVVQHLGQRPDATCYGALLEALTGIWNAAVRAAVVSRLRAQGLPPDDLLLRLEALSPTLGFQGGDREWARVWMADPAAGDAVLVQQCLVRLLLAVRGLAEARGQALVGPATATPSSPSVPPQETI
jgi:hypothetical protein